MAVSNSYGAPIRIRAPLKKRWGSRGKRSSILSAVSVVSAAVVVGFFITIPLLFILRFAVSVSGLMKVEEVRFSDLMVALPILLLFLLVASSWMMLFVYRQLEDWRDQRESFCGDKEGDIEKEIRLEVEPGAKLTLFFFLTVAGTCVVTVLSLLGPLF